MADYQILKSNGSLVIVPEEQIGSNPPLPIDLVGQKYQGYGQVIATTQVHLLENFANVDAPLNPIVGQLWFDYDINDNDPTTGKFGNKVLKVATPEVLPDLPDVQNTNTVWFTVGEAKNVGGEAEVFAGKDPATGELQFNTIVGTGATTVSVTDNVITVNSSNTDSGGTVTEGENRGTGGTNVFVPGESDATTLRFNVLSAGDLIDFDTTTTAGTIIINTSATNNTGTITGGTDLGTGTGGQPIYDSTTAPTMNFNRIAGAAPISVSAPSNGVITISSSAGGGTVTGGLSIGSGQPIFNSTESDASTLKFNSIVGGPLMSVGAPDANGLITINTSATNNAGTVTIGNTLGTGQAIYKSTTGSTMNFRSLKQAGSVVITEVDDEITISSNGEANTISNVGAGTGKIAKTQSGVNFPIKSLIGGNGISLINGIDEITINSTSMVAAAYKTVTSATINHVGQNTRKEELVDWAQADLGGNTMLFSHSAITGSSQILDQGTVSASSSLTLEIIEYNSLDTVIKTSTELLDSDTNTSETGPYVLDVTATARATLNSYVFAFDANTARIKISVIHDSTVTGPSPDTVSQYIQILAGQALIQVYSPTNITFESL